MDCYSVVPLRCLPKLVLGAALWCRFVSKGTVSGIQFQVSRETFDFGHLEATFVTFLGHFESPRRFTKPCCFWGTVRNPTVPQKHTCFAHQKKGGKAPTKDPYGPPDTPFGAARLIRCKANQ